MFPGLRLLANLMNTSAVVSLLALTDRRLVLAHEHQQHRIGPLVRELAYGQVPARTKRFRSKSVILVGNDGSVIVECPRRTFDAMVKLLASPRPVRPWLVELYAVSSPPITPQAPTEPAGWHADPAGRHQLRYWDGTVWTDYVSDQGTQSIEPL